MPPPPPPYAHTQHALYAYHAAPVHAIEYDYLPAPSHSTGVSPALFRQPLAPASPNVPLTRTAAPSSSTKPAAAPSKPKKSTTSTASSSKPTPTPRAPSSKASSTEPSTFLAPSYTLNPAGPASNSEIDFECPHCDKKYRGKHARSIWRRHLQDKHGIPLSAQPRRTRWDNDANRPKSEEEKRARTLDSKRRWARKNRAGGGGGASEVKPKAESGIFSVPSADGGSVGTPASEGEEEEGPDEPDSSFELSGEGWAADGVRGGSVQVFHHQHPQHHPYSVASNPFYPTSAGPSIYGRTPTKSAVPVPGSGLIDPYLASRPPLRSTSSMPPGYPSPDVVDGAAEALHLPQHYGGSASAHLLYQQGTNSGATNPYSQPFQPQLVAQEQPHAGSSYPILHHPRGGEEDEDDAEDLDDHRRLNPSLLSAPPRRPNSQPHVITAGQPAPIALPYFARRQSPARLLTTNLNGGVSGIAAGIPAPREKAEASTSNGLESPVKLRRTGTNGKGKEPIHAHRDDAAGILLALKAGPSSPMGPSHVQSPVSSVRGTESGRRRGTGSEDEEGQSDEEDEREVQALMLRSRAQSAGGTASPWRAALHNHHAHSTAAAVAAAASAASAISPRKRGRSESPAPNLNSTSSGEGSTAAAHALLATAKKAHAYATTLPSSAAANPRGWGHEMSLVATPTPGNMMRIAMESSPVVRFGAGAGAGAVGGGDSEGEMVGVGEEDEVEDAFTSSSGGGRRPRRGRSLSPSSQKGGRRRGGGGAGSSSSGGGGASSSSQPRPLHHHHPVGLTSELGDFDLEPPSSASIARTHHHHDPLRELDAAMQPHPGSSSSVVSHLATPAPAGSSTAMRTSSSADAVARHATHPHDPFLVAGASAAIPTTAAAHAALESVSRTSSPPGAFSSFLFSSPAHPQFSKTLGLTAAPGPGVLYTGVGGETPARGGLGPHASGALAALAGLGGRHSRAREFSAEEELMAVAARERERIEAMKTPVTARVGLEGVIGRRNGMPPSDLESNEEEGSEVTGTPGRESQSPGKTTVDEDDDEDGSLDD
ncbi:proteophosphoglycan ppg4 [Rhodotorula toruloides]|uniref:Proteophosphoglycan ppg4 n=1 Tax=Rhodotorula toruloides TaxID=5286 RepID=A0A511KCT4_RHOTO|nr:proteophosphoglycan ppg4 [Rhodotorula toruloides]